MCEKWRVHVWNMTHLHVWHNYDESCLMSHLSCVMSLLLVIDFLCLYMRCVGWLRLVGSLKSQVSFAEYRLFYRALLPKRPMIWRSLLVEATPTHIFYTWDVSQSHMRHDSCVTLANSRTTSHMWKSNVTHMNKRKKWQNVKLHQHSVSHTYSHCAGEALLCFSPLLFICVTLLFHMWDVVREFASVTHESCLMCDWDTSHV